MLQPEEQEYYRKCLEIYAEINSENFKFLKVSLEDLRDQCINRLANLDDKALIKEQGKLQVLNEILNYKQLVSAQVETFQHLENEN